MTTNPYINITPALRDLLIEYADRYETHDFINGDPSWFMHQVNGQENQETMAFLASCLSYGSRSQFMQKIQLLLDWSEGDTYHWVRDGGFAEHFSADSTNCFYRLYTVGHMYGFLRILQQMLTEHTTIGTYIKKNANDGLSAINAISRFFYTNGTSVIVPKDTQSACKRICMFLRWMVRSDSPVDLGLWSDFIDRRTLIIPLDTHVLHQSQRLGLISGKTASMATARRLTNTLAEIFPEDPLRGDFSLFGYGVNAR